SPRRNRYSVPFPRRDGGATTYPLLVPFRSPRTSIGNPSQGRMHLLSPLYLYQACALSLAVLITIGVSPWQRSAPLRTSSSVVSTSRTVIPLRLPGQKPIA